MDKEQKGFPEVVFEVQQMCLLKALITQQHYNTT